MHMPIHHLPHILFIWTHVSTSPKSPTHTTPPLYSYTHLPTAHPTQTHETEPDTSLVKAAESTLEPRLLSWGGGQGWLVTSDCYVRNSKAGTWPESPLHCRAYSTSVSSFVFWFLILWTSAPLSLCQKKQKRHAGLCQCGREDPVPLKAKPESNKMSTSAKKVAGCCPQWRFGKEWMPESTERRPSGILVAEGWGYRRADALQSWPHGSPTRPGRHGGKEFTAHVWKTSNSWCLQDCLLPVHCPCHWAAPPGLLEALQLPG